MSNLVGLYLMKLNKIGRYIAIVALFYGAINVTFAVAPKLKASDIVIPQPTEQNMIAVKRATTRLTQSHYRKFVLDDEFSIKIFKRYLNRLDPTHSTFLQSDVDELYAKYATKLDDDLNLGSLNNAFEIYKLLANRRYENYKYALSLLDSQPNLTQKDQIEYDREKAPWPKTQEEVQTLWKQRVKNDIINLKLKNKKWPEIKEKLIKRYNLAIRYLTQIRSDDITQIYLNAFAREIDPHTSYLAPRSAKNFNESMNLSLEGIGATLQSEDGDTIIKSLVKGAPAERSKKIKIDDKIVGVGQEKGEIEDVVGWRLEDVVEKIKGKRGTKVRLEIESKNGKSKIITLIRDKIHLDDQAVKLTVDNVNGKKIAVLKVPSFYIGLTKDTTKLLKEAHDKKVAAMIVDLRDNGGGSLVEAVNFSGLFITDGPIVQVRDSYGRIRLHEDTDQRQQYSGPLFVMINRFSASASEIFAAAMQDYNRGIILGQNTFGKGTVQQSNPLNFVYDIDQQPIGVIQYTIQKFYRINGGSTQLKGVKPDIAFPEIIDAKEYGEEKEDNPLEWDKIPSAIYSEADNARQMLAQLQSNHLKRIAVDPEFVLLAENLKIRNARNQRKFLSLNFDERKKENDEDDKKRLKDLNARFKREGKKLIKKLDDLPKDYEAPDFYLKEAEKIAVDFIQLSKKKLKAKSIYRLHVRIAFFIT